MNEVIADYLKVIQSTRSPKTLITYSQALKCFVEIVGDDSPITVETFIRFLRKTSDMNPSTQATYRMAVMGLYLFHASSHPEINFSALKQATRQFAQRKGVRLPKFDREAIEQLISYCENLRGDIIDYRDRAFVLTLADSGLRISEACALRRGSINWPEQYAIIIGKGNKEAKVRFSNRALAALQDYLRERKDAESGKPIDSLPLFSRHDHKSNHRVISVQAGGMWRSIKERMKMAGIDGTKVRIHDFRHYFVTIVYESKDDIYLAKELARHENITTTSRYAHSGEKADRAYHEIFNQKK